MIDLSGIIALVAPIALLILIRVLLRHAWSSPPRRDETRRVVAPESTPSVTAAAEQAIPADERRVA